MDFRDELELLSTLLDRPTPPASPARDNQLHGVGDVRVHAPRQAPYRATDSLHGQQLRYSALNGSMSAAWGSNGHDLSREMQGHGQQPLPTGARNNAHAQHNKSSLWSSMYAASQPPLLDAGQLRGIKSQQGQHHTCAAELDVQPGNGSPMAPRPAFREPQDPFARFMDEGYLMNGTSQSLQGRAWGSRPQQQRHSTFDQQGHGQQGHVQQGQPSPYSASITPKPEDLGVSNFPLKRKHSDIALSALPASSPRSQLAPSQPPFAGYRSALQYPPTNTQAGGSSMNPYLDATPQHRPRQNSVSGDAQRAMPSADLAAPHMSTTQRSFFKSLNRQSPVEHIPRSSANSPFSASPDIFSRTVPWQPSPSQSPYQPHHARPYDTSARPPLTQEAALAAQRKHPSPHNHVPQAWQGHAQPHTTDSAGFIAAQADPCRSSSASVVTGSLRHAIQTKRRCGLDAARVASSALSHSVLHHVPDAGPSGQAGWGVPPAAHRLSAGTASDRSVSDDGIRRAAAAAAAATAGPAAPLRGVAAARAAAAASNAAAAAEAAALQRLEDEYEGRFVVALAMSRGRKAAAAAAARRAKAMREILNAKGNKAPLLTAERRSREVLKWHKAQQTRRSRETQARLNALKLQDYSSYLELAAQAKDSRLREVIHATEAVMDDLILKVRQHQAEQGRDAPAGAGSSDEAADDSALPAHERYFNAVHSTAAVGPGGAAEPLAAEPMLRARGCSLREYQLAGVRFLYSLYSSGINGMLADDMGLGKTVQAITLIAEIMHRDRRRGPFLVLAPKAVLSNWTAEFEKWLGGTCEVLLYDGPADVRKQMVQSHVKPARFNVLLSHYHIAISDKGVLSRVQWEAVIVDEGHRLKNEQSRLTAALATLRTRARFLLTGTPLQNRLGELWALLNFILPSVFSCSDSFDAWFGGAFGGSSSDMELSEEEQLLIINRLHAVLRPLMLRRTKAEVASELPGKTERVVRCPLSAWQSGLYRRIATQRDVRDERGRSVTLSNVMVHLRKVCLHPALMYEGYLAPPGLEELVSASGKFCLLYNILPKLHLAGHRVLLFSQFTQLLDLLELFLARAGFVFLRLDGTTKAAERTRALQEFNRPGSPVFLFLLSTRAGGLGLNLQTADTVIIFDQDWNPQMDLQAKDRAHRLGQQRHVLVLVLVCKDTVEEHVLASSHAKRSLDNKVIQAGLFNDSSSAADRRAALEATLNSSNAGVSTGAGPEADKPVNRLISRSADEVRLFQRVDDAVAEMATSLDPPATPADAIAALARLCGAAPAGVAPGCGEVKTHTTVVEAEPACPSLAADPAPPKTPPSTASAAASPGTAPASDRGAGTPAAADCADADMAPAQPAAASRQDGATGGCESNLPGSNLGKSPASGSAGGGSELPVKAQPAMEAEGTPPRERAGADSGAGGGSAGEPPPIPVEPAVRLRCVLRGDGSLACDVRCSGGTPPAGDAESRAASHGAADQSSAGATGHGASGTVSTVAARSPQHITDVAVMHNVHASAAVAPEPSSTCEAKKVTLKCSASAGEAEPTCGGPHADTCCDAGNCYIARNEAKSEVEGGEPADKEEPTVAGGGFTDGTGAASAMTANLGAPGAKDRQDAALHAGAAGTDAPATAQGSAAAGGGSKCTPEVKVAGGDAEAAGVAPMDTDEAAAAAGGRDTAAATAPTDVAADAAADCADGGGDVAGTSAASQVLARLAHAEGAKSLRQWLSCVGRIPPMAEGEVPAWAAATVTDATGEQPPLPADGGACGEDAGGGDSGGGPRKSRRRRRAQVESLADSDQDAFWDALIGAVSGEDTPPAPAPAVEAGEGSGGGNGGGSGGNVGDSGGASAAPVRPAKGGGKETTTVSKGGSKSRSKGSGGGGKRAAPRSGKRPPVADS